MNLRSVARKFSPVARRDAAIAALEAEHARLRRELHDQRAQSAQAPVTSESPDVLPEATRTLPTDEAAPDPRPREPEDPPANPSWRYKLAEAARLRYLIKVSGARDPVWTVNDKISGYTFARSWGCDVPATIVECPDFSEIAWDDLPEAFVVKTVQGTASQGVVPLERRGDMVVDLLNVRRGPIRVADVVARLEAKHAAGNCSRDVVIEELLRSPFDQSRLAPDLKVYCFYGEVGMIMIRDGGGSRHPKHFTVRYLDVDGTDLGDAKPGLTIDPDLPAPLHLDDVVAAGTRLSAAVPTPFVRIDFYERPDRVVFGEVTPSPGGNQNLRADLDLRFGQMWERAEARLRTEMISLKAFGVRYGDATE